MAAKRATQYATYELVRPASRVGGGGGTASYTNTSGGGASRGTASASAYPYGTAAIASNQNKIASLNPTSTTNTVKNTNNSAKNITVEEASKDTNLKNSTTPTTVNTGSATNTTNTTGGGAGYSATTAGFVASDTYQKAMEYTQSLLDQLSSGRTSYTDKINSIMDQIANRDKFSYDMNTDSLFQNMLSSYMRSGQIAMQDTMGQAAGLTGGYGSSYATSAANQAYNSYIQDAYNNLPDYYQLALDAYNAEGQEMYNQLGMYQDADNTEYNRLASAYSANAQNAANIYDQEYNNYWQTQNYNQSERQFAAEMAYKNAQAAQSQSNWEKEYQLSVDKANASSNAGTITTTEWNSINKQIEDYVNANGAGASLDELYATIANQYGMNDTDVATMLSNGSTAQKTFSNDNSYVLDLKSGAYYDKSGNIVQNAHSNFSLYKTGTGNKEKANDAQYIDDYRNIVTYAQLKANNLTNRIK